MSNTRIVLVILIFSEWLIVLYGAQAVWRSRNVETGKRTIMGMVISFCMVMYSISRLIALIINLRHGRELSTCMTPVIEFQALWQAVAQCTAAITFSLWMANANRNGPIKRQIVAVLDQLR